MSHTDTEVLHQTHLNFYNGSLTILKILKEKETYFVPGFLLQFTFLVDSNIFIFENLNLTNITVSSI